MNIRVWFYNDLPTDLYRASLSLTDDGKYFFMATPRRGSYCYEGYFASEKAALAAIKSWLAGSTVAEIYSAAY